MQALAHGMVLLFVVSTMFGVCLTITLGDLAAERSQHRWLLRAIVINLLALPLVALVVTHGLGTDPAMTAALLVVATAPGGAAAIKLASLAKLNVLNTVGLVVSLLVLGVLTQPFLLPWLLQGTSVSTGAIVRSLFLTVLLPLLLGCVVRIHFPAIALKLVRPCQAISTSSMVINLVLLPVIHWEALLAALTLQVALTCTLFVVLIIAAGWLLGGPRSDRRRILAMVCGQPNLAAAFVIAVQDFGSPAIMIRIVLLLLANLLVLLPLTLYFARRPVSVGVRHNAPS